MKKEELLKIALCVAIFVGVSVFLDRFATIGFVPQGAVLLEEKDGVRVYYHDTYDDETTPQVEEDIAFVTDRGKVIAEIGLGYDDVLKIASVTDNQVYLIDTNAQQQLAAGSWYVVGRKGGSFEGTVQYAGGYDNYWATTSDSSKMIFSNVVDTDGAKKQLGLIVFSPESADPQSVSIPLPWTCTSVNDVSISPDNDHIAVICQTTVTSKTINGALYVTSATNPSVNEEVKLSVPVQDGPGIPFASEGDIVWEDEATPGFLQ